MNLQANRQLVPVEGGAPIPLIRARISIGSLESCDICLKLPDVSGKHCELTYIDEHWLICDLGTTNGIKINGNRITEAQVLRSGDEITIAERSYIFE